MRPFFSPVPLILLIRPYNSIAYLNLVNGIKFLPSMVQVDGGMCLDSDSILLKFLPPALTPSQSPLQPLEIFRRYPLQTLYLTVNSAL